MASRCRIDASNTDGVQAANQTGRLQQTIVGIEVTLVRLLRFERVDVEARCQRPDEITVADVCGAEMNHGYIK